MIVSVYTPNGIVVATASFDSFHEYLESEDGTLLSPIYMEGLPHTYTFWDRYALTYNGLNSYAAETSLPGMLEELSRKWDSVPPIAEFMPYLKKLFVDNHIQVIGIVAAYDIDKDGTFAPFVYQILGENIRRINLDDDGHLNYNCVYLEKTPHIGKLLRETRIKNGDIWEDSTTINLRCDLYSIQKSIDLCRFMLRTSHYLENINSVLYETPLKADISVITNKNVETKIIEI